MKLEMLQRKVSKFKICILLRVVVNGLGIHNLIRDRSVPNFAVPNLNMTIRIRADDTTMTKAA